MAICGHCGKRVKGIRDHIRAKHGDPFYEQGPDNRYYGYSFLKNVSEGLVIDRPHWNAFYPKAAAAAAVVALPSSSGHL